MGIGMELEWEWEWNATRGWNESMWSCLPACPSVRAPTLSASGMYIQ